MTDKPDARLDASSASAAQDPRGPAEEDHCGAAEFLAIHPHMFMVPPEDNFDRAIRLLEHVHSDLAKSDRTLTFALGIMLTNMVGITVREMERALILATVHHCNGNRTHAARMLGISLRTLRNKLRLYRIPTRD